MTDEQRAILEKAIESVEEDIIDVIINGDNAYLITPSTTFLMRSEDFDGLDAQEFDYE